MDLKDRVVFITGSAIRLGKVTAMLLASRGARVVIHYRSNAREAEATAAVIAESGNRPLILQGDVASADDWKRMRDKIVDVHGRIDVLINNAAIFYKTPFLESTEAQWDDFMNVNLKSVYLGCRTIAEVMISQGEGKIVNIADIAADRVWPSYIPYCVSKAGVIALTKGLARALAPHVTVNAVNPGTVLLPEEYDAKAGQILADKTLLKRLGKAEDIANTIAFLLEGSDFITGAEINVDGGRSIN